MYDKTYTKLSETSRQMRLFKTNEKIYYLTRLYRKEFIGL